ncbi:MAG: NapC/NirT family cytochrome c [Coriobacteriia bacterium]|nr:NapC/NirT family cytochrome c [Coriobacteriia bacterium]
MKKSIIWIGVIALMLGVAITSVVYTERPQFCPTCHEMTPYYDAWAQGTHAETSCMDCHVESGVVNHLLHKFVALGEVWSHFTTTPSYPAYTAVVPDHRCVACHETVADPSPPLPGFLHAEHAKAGECQLCHQNAGHAITFGALADAGILSSAYKDRPADAVTGQPKLVDQKPGVVAGHTDVICGQCHDMVSVGCEYCHEKPAKHVATKLPCAQCHKPKDTFKGAKFPHTGVLKCADCHQPPANHYVGAKCEGCHKVSVPFKKTVFRHVGNTGEHSYKSFPCVDCHPKGYGSAGCVKCHKGGAPQDD